MSEINACETPMHDHVRRFWAMLESETVSITVNIRRDTSSVPYWDGSSFSDAVAKALVADRAALPSAAVAERKPRGWICEGCSRFSADPEEDLKRLRLGGHLSCCPERKISPLYLDPPPTSELEAENARLLEKQKALIEAAVIAERESCAFAVECHSGLGDLETIEACAQIVRDRCDPALRSDSIHLTPERYAELESAENRLAETLKALEDIEVHARLAPVHTSQVTAGQVLSSKLTMIRDIANNAARRAREGGKVDG